MSKEIIEAIDLLEKIKNSRTVTGPTDERLSVILELKKIAGQVIKLLKHLPPAGEFTIVARELADLTEEDAKEKGLSFEGYTYCLTHTLHEACDIIDTAKARLKIIQEALEQSKEIFGKKLRSIRGKQDKAKKNLAFIESRYWNGIYYQIFELRHEIERMLDKENLNEFCILVAFMPEEKKKEALAKAKQ